MAKPTLTTSAAFRTMEQNLPVMVTSRSIWEMSDEVYIEFAAKLRRPSEMFLCDAVRQ